MRARVVSQVISWTRCYHRTRPRQDSCSVWLECVLNPTELQYMHIVFFCYVIKTSITYLKSSLSSFLDASKGTFRTRSLELFCFFVEAVFRCATMSLKRNIDGPRDVTISQVDWFICRLLTGSYFLLHGAYSNEQWFIFYTCDFTRLYISFFKVHVVVTRPQSPLFCL